MVARGSAAPPTPGSKNSAQPQIDPTASVHSFSSLTGDVRVGANALIAPGASVRADGSGPFHIGAGSQLQDGVVVHGLEQGRILGEDQNQYSVWIGDNTSITHMALIHGPAYVGDNCFIGFRSTVFNARVGAGCIVMMHVLIQDVEIPPGKFVPSGAVITSQQQADRLPDVQETDRRFAAHMAGANNALRSGYHSAEKQTQIAPIRQQLERVYSNSDRHSSSSGSSHPSSSSSHISSAMQNTRLAPEVVDYVRQLLSQGLQVGAEHADKRRFQTSSWYSCGSISSNRDSDVLNTIESWVNEYGGEYVRVYGIDPRAKRRVSEVIVQRPDGSGMRKAPAPAASSSYGGSSSSRSNYSSSGYSSSSHAGGSSKLSPEVIEKVHQFINQGFKIGTEHADARRFQTSSWQSCSPIQTSRPAEALSALESCLAEHQGEYVRVFGIDPKVKRRVSEMIIQRPGSSSNGAASSNGYQSTSRSAASNGYGSSSNGHSSYSSSSSSNQGSTGGKLSSEVVNQVRQLLSQGYRVSAEHADARRFQTSSWKTCAPIQSNRDSEVLAALESCLSENSGEYVRLVGVDTKTKRRVTEMIVQRP